MSDLDDSPRENLYQFPSWSTSLSRSHTVLSSKIGHNKLKLRIDNRSQAINPPKQYLSRFNVQLLTESLRLHSPPLLHQPTPTPDLCSTIEHELLDSSNNQCHELKPIRLKSAAIAIPIKPNSDDTLLKNFPKQTHERRKMMQDRLRQKQLNQKFIQSETDTWFHLRESLAELKRLATSEEILIDPTTSVFNCDGFSFEALHHVVNKQLEDKKGNKFKCESGKYLSINSTSNSNTRPPMKAPNSQKFLSRPRLKRRATETYPHQTLEPLVVAAKPIHSIEFTTNNYSTKPKSKHKKAPTTAPARVRATSQTALIQSITEKNVLLLTPDVLNTDEVVSTIPSPDFRNIKEDDEVKEKQLIQLVALESNGSEVLSNISVKSKIKLKPQVPRCRSAMEPKSLNLLNKDYPRFILITDEEHRIESWYHKYPFIISDDLLQSLQSKQNKATVSAYFTDDNEYFLDSHITTKTYLQSKLFHIDSDWKKYDIIFISNNIYQQIIIYLQTIINLIIKSSGKVIHIYQINHREDLKKQIRYIVTQLKQRIFSHV